MSLAVLDREKPRDIAAINYSASDRTLRRGYVRGSDVKLDTLTARRTDVHRAVRVTCACSD